LSYNARSGHLDKEAAIVVFDHSVRCICHGYICSLRWSVFMART
jgi:hypothetical protein